MKVINIAPRAQQTCTVQRAQTLTRCLFFCRPKRCSHLRGDDCVLSDGSEPSEQPLSLSTEITHRQEQRSADALLLFSCFVSNRLGDQIVIYILKRLKTGNFA